MRVVKNHMQKGALFLFVDVSLIVVSLGLAYFVRFELLHGAGEKTWPIYPYIISGILTVVILIICMRNVGLYDVSRNIKRIECMFLVVKATSLALLALMALAFFYRSYSFSRIYLLLGWFFVTFLLAAGRYLLIQLDYAKKERRKEVIRVLLVGTNGTTKSIIDWANDNPHYGREIVGVLTKESAMVGKTFHGCAILGLTDGCESFVATLKPDELVILDTEFSRGRLTELIALCEENGVDFKIGADLFGMMERAVVIEYIRSVPLLGFHALPLDDFWNRVIKRTFDILFSLFFMVISIPAWLMMVILVKCQDGGPIFYAQDRIGRDGCHFTIFKFRTMKVDAEQSTGPVWAREGDERCTPMGRWMRQWNLDEIPQLWNVLKGDMSLVGPRPERPHFVEQFRSSVPRYMTRHKVKSGLTGWAQVHGYRGNTPIEERIKYDIFYLENWSLVLDVKIVLMTFLAFKNAY